MFKVVPEYEFIEVSEEGVVRSTVFDIKSRKTWKELSCNYEIPYPKKKLDSATVMSICEDYRGGMGRQEILSKYSDSTLTRHTLRLIIQKKTFKHITEKYDWE